VTVPVGTTLEEAERILQKHRIEKLLVVDQDFNLKGLITVKDIQKKLEYPRAAKTNMDDCVWARQLARLGIFWNAPWKCPRQRLTCSPSTRLTGTPSE